MRGPAFGPVEEPLSRGKRERQGGGDAAQIEEFQTWKKIRRKSDEDLSSGENAKRLSPHERKSSLLHWLYGKSEISLGLKMNT